jgi:hypothetical protein
VEVELVRQAELDAQQQQWRKLHANGQLMLHQSFLDAEYSSMRRKRSDESNRRSWQNVSFVGL